MHVFWYFVFAIIVFIIEDYIIKESKWCCIDILKNINNEEINKDWYAIAVF